MTTLAHNNSNKLLGSRTYERVYIGGPYTHSNPAVVARNVSIAATHAAEIMALGHDVFCPHTMSGPIEAYSLAGLVPGAFTYERWMRICFGVIENWATALFVIAPSLGTDREVRLADGLGLTIYRDMSEVPAVQGCARALEQAAETTETTG